MNKFLIGLLLLSSIALIATETAQVANDNKSQDQDDKPEKPKQHKPEQDGKPHPPPAPILAGLDVVGYSSKTVSPNIIKIGLEFTATACTVAEALGELSQQVKRAISAIKNENCKDEMITTVYYDIKQIEIEKKDDKDDKRDNDHKPKQFKPPVQEGPTTEYVVVQIIEVTVTSKKQSAAVIDCAVANGARLAWVTWDITRAVEKEIVPFLIRAAIDDAVSKAKKVAQRLGFKLQKVNSVKLLDNNTFTNDKLTGPGLSLTGIRQTRTMAVDIQFTMIKMASMKN
jgi:uncharacterized protein YggE